MQGKGGIIEFIVLVKQDFFPIARKELIPKGEVAKYIWGAF